MFCPKQHIDLFWGEQQKNVDWALLKSLWTTGVSSEQGARLIYNIICQYFIHLWDQIGHLLPDRLEIDRAIGLFHIHDHKDQCFHRFASSFIPGSGVVAGEILESLWANLNTIAHTTWTATLAHQVKVINNHATNSNHKKGLAMCE